MPLPAAAAGLLLLLATPAAPPAATLVHRNVRVEDGLVQSQVNALLEASDGHLWMGTFGGISRWDGERFENFRAAEGLAGLDIRAFHETLGGDILVATADAGISRFRDGTFTNIGTDDGLPSASTRGFLRDTDGRLFLATGNGLLVFADESLDLATARHELPGVRVSGLAPRAAGGLYLSTFGDGVLVYRDGKTTPLVPVDDRPGGIIRAVRELPDGRVLFSVYHHGVWTWRDGVVAPFVYGDRLAGHDVMAFVPGSDGTLYLPTIEGGVGMWREDGFAMLTTAEGLADDTSWAVHEGTGGTVYVGTWDGVGIYHPGRVLTLDMSTGLHGETITALAELPDGTVAIASIEGGVDLFDGERVTRHLGVADGLAHGRVWSLLAARDGALYVGTHAGLNVLRDGRLRTVFREEDAPHGRIYAMHEDADGALWLATYGGIRVLRDGRPEPVDDERDAARSTVYSVAGTRDGDLLFGTARGVVTVRGGQAIPPPDDSPVAELHVWAIREGRDGTIYLGTNGNGLVFARGGARTGEWESLTAEDGLSSDAVFGIAEAADGRLFLTTQRGVSIVTFAGGAPSIRLFRSADGLAGEECNQGACLGDGRGRFWFGTIRGATRYDPAHDRPLSIAPRVIWRSVRVLGEELPLAAFATRAVFTHRQNFFRFEFGAAQPRAPHRVSYRHRLTGLDPAWIEGRETAADYTSLPPGRYAFEVAARNEWGIWSEPVALSFRITPPFWKTWWFVLLAITAGAAAVGLAVAARMRHLLAYEQLRTRIAADLHDDIGAGLAEISIVTRLLERKLPAEQRDVLGTELTQLAVTSRRLVRSMSDIVWLIQPRRDTLRDLVTRLADSFGNVCEAAGIRLHVENLESLSEVALGMERRQHLFLIFREAMNNALKYGECGEMTLSAHVEGGRIRMSLRDDGVGFDVAAVRAGNGLGNMRDRAARAGGALTLRSAPGDGTLVEFSGRALDRARGPMRR